MSATKTRIRVAAVELFAAQGFAGTGIRELADQVGTTTSSLYHHVQSKDDLLDMIVETSMGAMNDVADYWVGVEGGAPDRLAGLVASHVVIHAMAPDEAVVVDRQLGAMRPGSRRRAIAERDRYERVWCGLVAAGVETGDFQVDNPELATRALLGAATAVADWYRPDGLIDERKLAAEYVTMSFDLINARVRPTVPDLTDVIHVFTNRWDSQ